MIRRTLRATLAALLASALVAVGLVIPAQPATAAVLVCYTANQSKVSRGKTYYRAIARCTGQLPDGKRYFRIKAVFSVLGRGLADYGPFYGLPVKPGGRSATKWVAWPYRANSEGRKDHFL